MLRFKRTSKFIGNSLPKPTTTSSPKIVNWLLSKKTSNSKSNNSNSAWDLWKRPSLDSKIKKWNLPKLERPTRKFKNTSIRPKGPSIRAQWTEPKPKQKNNYISTNKNKQN